jgi:PHD/YefM family antitoxin component YafN of YafNO toxin-antitoxin module
MRIRISREFTMLDVSKDIRSLTEFKRETPKFLVELKESGRAVLLTVNGEAEIAVMSAKTFQRVLEAMDTLDSLRCIREGLEQARRGEGLPADEFFASLRKRLGVGERGS